MTTLPQTTTPRLPRPMSSMPASVPAHWSGGVPAPAAGMTGADVWRVLRANMWLIAVMVVVFAGLGAVANYLLDKHYARYTANGYVQVTPSRLVNPVKDSVFDAGDMATDPLTLGVELRSQAAMMKTDTLFAEVLVNGQNIRQTNWFQQFKRKVTQPDGSVTEAPDIAKAKEDLYDHYSVMPVNDSRLIIVSFTWKDPKDCKLIVEDLVSQHLRTQLASKTAHDDAQSSELNYLKTGLNTKVNTLSQLMLKLGLELSDSGISPMPNYVSPKELELQTLVQLQTKAQMDYNEAKAMYDGVASKLAQGLTPPMVDTMMGQDFRLQQYRMMADQAEAEAKQLELVIGKGNPQYDRARAVADTQMQKAKEYEDEQRVKVTQMVREQAEGALSTAQANLQGLSEQIEGIKTALGEMDYKRLQYLNYFDEHKLLLEQRKNLEDQLAVLTTRKGQDRAGVDWATKPQTPDIPSFPKLYVTMTASIALGLLLALTIAFTREFLDTTVKSPRDIARVGQITLLGMIPHEEDDSQAAGVPLPMAIAAAPTSIIAEQFRQVRTRLQHAASLDTTRSILVTSPSPGDGKSTVACNIAAGLALNGRRILLVDANFRRPEINKIYNIGNDVGLSTALGSIDNFESAVKQTSVPNLSVMATGPRPSNPTELLESQLFIDFIERALEDYDHVIFDSGPMLLVSETAAMAPRVDGVITVVRAATNSRGLLQRMRDSLRQLKSEHLGVVLNAVRAQGGGYYGRNIKTYYEYQNGNGH